MTSESEFGPKDLPPFVKTGWAVANDNRAQNHPIPGNGLMYIRPGFDWTTADGYLFDIDGTLLNSHDAVHYFAFHNALRTVFGMDCNTEGIPIHGNTDVGILRAITEKQGILTVDFEAALPRVLELMCAEAEENADRFKPEVCRSVVDVLDYLLAEGKVLGIASGNLARIGWLKISAAGLRQYFSFGAFAGEWERRAEIFKYGLTQAAAALGREGRIVVLGDTPADIAAARECSVEIIAIATGIYSFEELRSHNPDICASSAGDLLSLIPNSQ